MCYNKWMTVVLPQRDVLQREHVNTQTTPTPATTQDNKQ